MEGKFTKVISNRNGFLLTISLNFKILKENKHHISKPLTFDYKCYKEGR